MVLALLTMTVACSESGPEVSDVRIGLPAGPNAALYMTIVGGSESDSVIGAATTAARAVELHESTMNDDGTMGMGELEAIEVPAGATVVLEPGGIHLMLVDVEPLEVGEEVEVSLTWEHGGDMTLLAEVVPATEVMGG